MSDAHLARVERRIREVVLRKGDWTPDPGDLDDFATEYDRRGAALAERDAEIAQLRADLAYCRRFHIDPLPLAAAPTPTENEGDARG